MIRQQTIVMDIDKGKLFEVTKDKETFFESTDYDSKVEECLISIIDSGGAVLGIQNHVTNDNLIAIILYDDKPSNVTKVQSVPNLSIPPTQ